VHVAVPRRAAGRGRLARVLEVDEDQARAAAAGPRGGADGHGILLLLVDDHVVAAADGELVPKPRQVLVRGEGDGGCRVDSEELPSFLCQSLFFLSAFFVK